MLGKGLVAPGPTEENMGTDLPVQPDSSLAPEKDLLDFFNLDFGEHAKNICDFTKEYRIESYCTVLM